MPKWQSLNVAAAAVAAVAAVAAARLALATAVFPLFVVVFVTFPRARATRKSCSWKAKRFFPFCQVKMVSGALSSNAAETHIESRFGIRILLEIHQNLLKLLPTKYTEKIFRFILFMEIYFIYI